MTANEKIGELLKKEKYTFDDLVDIVEVLRSEVGCPWDREQTHASIRRDFIEETYEVIEAIDTENPELLREELGDVLLQVVFHARIEEEEGRFDMDAVAEDICRKLIHRHPHVFGDAVASTTDKVLSNWEQIKSEEKSRSTVTDKLRAIPPMLPALMRAQKVGKKAACFDFADSEAVLLKLDEEIEELREAIAGAKGDSIEEEMGDVLLTLTSLCRKLGVDAEVALTRSTEKFINRFETLENITIERNLDINSMTMEELDKIWDEFKHKN